MTFPRRGFLRLGIVAGAANFLRIRSQAQSSLNEPLFAEVPPSVSGIR